ncbi:VOC family protein [Saccharothrix syringae]|uniref:VOC family protein n=1 Tax=Saccharothrix syringae TaxID=103733 RepID=A0A5Q0H956_SACSY|nr:VOC family protein [Saccharothrix syringae]QFZ22729.1 VOC family protein [Saccharothrix syringae]
MPTPGTPAWVEVSSEDPAASREFYARLLGWTYEVVLDPHHHGYTVARHGGEPVAGVFESAEGVPPGWLLHLHAADVEEVAARVPELGGEVVAGPLEAPGASRVLLTADPTGAVVGFRQVTGAAAATSRPGALNWAELTTRDAGAADRFYGALFGYEERQLGDGGAFDYKTWSKDGAEAVGRLRVGAGFPAGVPSHWMVYFGVDPGVGADASAERAVALGGRVEVPPFDAPHGRTAVVRDPFGALFSLVDAGDRVG